MTDDTITAGTEPVLAGEPSVEELLAARERAAGSAAAHFDLPKGKVAIYDPEYESLTYGPNSEITFGPKGGFEPNIWIGDADNELLPAMLAAHPKMFQVGASNKVYVCDVCGEEFNVLNSMRMHRVRVHGGPIKT